MVVAGASAYSAVPMDSTTKQRVTISLFTVLTSKSVTNLEANLGIPSCQMPMESRIHREPALQVPRKGLIIELQAATSEHKPQKVYVGNDHDDEQSTIWWSIS